MHRSGYEWFHGKAIRGKWSSDIVIKKNGGNRIGLNFLKLFKKIVINNSTNKFIFGELTKAKLIERDYLFSFDLIDGLFVVDSKILNEPLSSQLNIDDKFIEINSMKASDFNSYCEFNIWREKLRKCDYLDLKTSENKIIRINNCRK